MLETTAPRIQAAYPEGEEWKKIDIEAVGDNLGYRFEVLIRPGEQGGYVSRIGQLKGVHSQGSDLSSVIKNTHEALRGCLESYLQNNQPIPLSENERKATEEISLWIVVNV